MTGRKRRLPEGVALFATFLALATLTGFMLRADLAAISAARPESVAAPHGPVRMARPAPDDQIRPYLPSARPLAPGEDLASPRRPAFTEGDPMAFRRGPNGLVFADGTIVPGTAELFAAMLDGEPVGVLSDLVLHSPGGSVRDAVAMARLIRARGLTTHVVADGYCASSCPLLFAAGERRVAHVKAWIGVHQVYALEQAVGTLAEGMDQGQRVSAEAQLLLLELGVDPRVWMHAMQTQKDQLYIFTPEDLADLRLATELDGLPPPPADADEG